MVTPWHDLGVRLDDEHGDYADYVGWSLWLRARCPRTYSVLQELDWDDRLLIYDLMFWLAETDSFTGDDCSEAVDPEG